MPHLIKYRLFLLTFVCCSLLFKASAQPTFTLKGVISKKQSTERVGQVVITDLNSKVTMMSDDVGWFTIKTAVGDTLLFTKTDYTDQKIVVLNTADMPVYLQPVINLSEVKIEGQSKRQELSEVMGQYRSQGTFYDGKPPALSFLTSPLTGLYELFGKTPGRAKRFAAFSKGEMEYAEVRRRYNVTFVKRITKLTDTLAIQKFMEYYTPTFEDLKEWNDYELISHVTKSFEYYKKHPPRPIKNEFKLPELKE